MAKVKLDTVFEGEWENGKQVGDPLDEALRFITALNAQGIKIDWDGSKVNGWPEITYIGERKALENMITECWGDSDLIAYIEEG